MRNLCTIGVALVGPGCFWVTPADVDERLPGFEADAVGPGIRQTCAIQAVSGDTWCWGNTGGTVPDQTFEAIATGYEFACGLFDGRVQCWGQIEGVSPDDALTDLDAGYLHYCVRSDEGWVVCAGDDSAGQSTAPSGVDFVAVSAGGGDVASSFSCGLHDDGTIECWGADADGQTDVPNGTFAEVSAGARHACARTDAGFVQCWGDDESGQLAAPSGAFSAVAAGGTFSCALALDSRLECWGDEHVVSEAPAGEFVAVTAGYDHACAISTSGRLSCWGLDMSGQTDIPSCETEGACP